MKLQEGVFLHLIPAKAYKTNRLKFRFAAPIETETITGRALLSNLLEMGNQDFPTAQLLRKRLASLYGATLSTQVIQKGRVHCVDLTITYAKSAYLPAGVNLLDAILDLVEAVLFRPLVQHETFQSDIFETEQRNMYSYLLSELEDSFTLADHRLRSAFFGVSPLGLPVSGTPELLQQETPTLVYKRWQSLLQGDRLDIFFLGEEDTAHLIERIKAFPFDGRQVDLQFEGLAPQVQATQELWEQKEASQSVLQLAYHLPVVYKDVNYATFLVFNGLFGLHPHSKLFSVVREQKGLAYTIGTQCDVFTGLYSLYMGISKEDLPFAMQLVEMLWEDMKEGRFDGADIEKTKKLLIESATVAEDKPSYTVERAYNDIVFPKRSWSKGGFAEAVNSVTKKEVQELASLFRMQITYFLEGTE